MKTQSVRLRLPGVEPASLREDDVAFDGVLRQSIERYFQGFVTQQPDGTLIGPFPAMQRFPELGRPLWDVSWPSPSALCSPRRSARS